LEAANKKAIRISLTKCFEDNCVIFGTSDNYKSGLPDMLGYIHGNPFAFEFKVVRRNQIKLQPGQLPWIRRLDKIGVLAGFILYYPEIRKYRVFTSDEIKRKCYKKNLIPDDIPSWTKNQLVLWIGESLQEPHRKFFLSSIRSNQ